MKTCPHCNHKISDTAKKCKYCWGWATNDYEDLKTRRVDISNKEKNDNVIARTIWIIAGILMIIWWYVSYEHNKIKDWYDTIKYDNWDRYEWEWKNDMKDWFGKWYWADWDRYEWEWKNDNREWKWTYYWADWTKYVGERKNDKKEWYWKYYWTDWYKYEWYYKNGREDWEAIEYRTDWRRFEWYFKVWYAYNWKVLNNYGKQVWYVKNWIFYNNDWSYIQTFYKFDEDPEKLLK